MQAITQLSGFVPGAGELLGQIGDDAILLGARLGDFPAGLTDDRQKQLVSGAKFSPNSVANLIEMQFAGAKRVVDRGNPGSEPAVRGAGAIARPPASQLGGEKGINCRLRRLACPRPIDSQFAGDTPGDAAPAWRADEILIVDNDPLRAARGVFGIEQMTKPEHHAPGRGHPVALGKRLGNIERVAHRQQVTRLDPLLGEQLRPQGHQPAKPGILHPPECDAGEVAGENRRQLAASRQRWLLALEPGGQRTDVIPAPPKRRHQPFVNRDDVVVLPIAARVVGGRDHQSVAKRDA